MGEIRTLPDRRSIRMPGYDYASVGVYFITICAHERRCLFGDVVGEKVVLSQIGAATERCWQAIPGHFAGAELDEFVVMPNHLHGLVVVSAEATARRSIGTIVGSFKSAAAREINRVRGTPGQPVWQRNYYEHIIRDEKALDHARQYIADNPRLWAEDAENPARAISVP